MMNGPTELPRGRSLQLAAALLTLVSACATTPELQLEERLDEHTGVTITTLDRPIEFFCARPDQGIDAASFADLGLAEANRMGTRSYYVWISVLWGRTDPQVPGAPQPASITIEPGSAALAFDPAKRVVPPSSVPLYAPPASWSSTWVFALTVREARTIARAPSLALTIEMRDGERQHFSLWKPPTRTLPLFADQLLDGARPTR